MQRVIRSLVSRERSDGHPVNKAGRRFAGMLVASMVMIALAATPAVAGQQVPFSGAYSGEVAMTETGAAFEGSGKSSLPGLNTIEGTVAMLGAPTIESCDGFAARHTVTLFAANGSELSLVVTDNSCLVSPGLYHGTGTFEITGGAGKYEGATGSGTFEGYGDFNTGTFRQTFQGTISY